MANSDAVSSEAFPRGPPVEVDTSPRHLVADDEFAQAVGGPAKRHRDVVSEEGRSPSFPWSLSDSSSQGIIAKVSSERGPSRFFSTLTTTASLATSFPLRRDYAQCTLASGAWLALFVSPLSVRITQPGPVVTGRSGTPSPSVSSPGVSGVFDAFVCGRKTTVRTTPTRATPVETRECHVHPMHEGSLHRGEQRRRVELAGDRDAAEDALANSRSSGGRQTYKVEPG